MLRIDAGQFSSQVPLYSRRNLKFSPKQKVQLKNSTLFRVEYLFIECERRFELSARVNEEAKPAFDLTTSSEVQAGHICQSISSVVKKRSIRISCSLLYSFSTE